MIEFLELDVVIVEVVYDSFFILVIQWIWYSGSSYIGHIGYSIDIHFHPSLCL